MKYEVRVIEVVSKSITIEADGRNEAMALGLEQIVNGSPNSYTTKSEGSKTVDCYEVND